MDENRHERSFLMIVEGSDGQPSLPEAAAQLGVSVGDVDSQIGVIELDRAQGLYGVFVTSYRDDVLGLNDGATFRGPYSSPHIEPLG
jgi:hypothetical protein